MTPDAAPADRPRRRGRPLKEIRRDDLADAVERLFLEGGIEAVSIERTAVELGVSRATLYRSVPTKQDLLGALFERMTSELLASAKGAASDDGRAGGERLRALMHVHIESAIRMRHYLVVLFDGEWLPEHVYASWRQWRTEYEGLWHEAVAAAIADGTLRAGDPVIATRLVLGMCIWTSRWYRPKYHPGADEIADIAFRLLDQRTSPSSGGTP